MQNTPDIQDRLDRWLGTLARDNVVVAYDPASEDGSSTSRVPQTTRT
jgi:hypothetical protein